MENSLEICIPAYRRPNELRACIQSIVSQKEFIKSEVTIRIFDDAPHDPSEKSIHDFLLRYPKKIFYRKNKKNLGFEENIAQLLETGKSTYCLVITDDDLFFPNTLQKIQELFKKHQHITLVRSAFAMQKNGKLERIHSIFSRNTSISPDNKKDIAKMFRDSDALSGTCFLRSSLDMPGYRKHIGSMYPHMYLVGYSSFLGESYYFNDPYIYHTVGNTVFWEYARDYMISGIMDIIYDLDKKYQGFFAPAAKLVFSSVPYVVYINLFHPKRLVLFLWAMIEKKYVLLREFWLGCVLGLYTLLHAKLHK